MIVFLLKDEQQINDTVSFKSFFSILFEAERGSKRNKAKI
jgi:hypothetical protein